MNQDSYKDMLAKVQAFHDKHDFKNTGGEDLTYRVALMEETADLFILLLGTAIAADVDLNHAFWNKMDKIMQRDSKMVNGRIRVSEFKDV